MSTTAATTTTNTITVNGVELFYDLTGEGDPLVLVHGGWTDLDSWQFVVPELASSFRVLAYDRRGHSRSRRPVGQGSRRQDEDDLIALLEALDMAPAHLVGNSYGGSISLSVAAVRPDLVRSVAVHEPPLVGAVEDDQEHRSTVQLTRASMDSIAAQLRAGEIETGTKRFMEEIALGPGSWSMLPEDTRDVFIANAPMFVDVQDDPAWDQLRSIELGSLLVPTLVSDGDQSVPLFHAITDALVRELPAAAHHTFVGAGHAPHLTHPHEYVDVIRTFTQASER